MARPVVHIGYPKSGSTFLQRNVFPFLDGCEYLGLSGREKDETYDELSVFYNGVSKSDSLNFSCEECREIAQRYLNKSNKESVIFSHEALVSVLYAYPDAVVKAQRLHDVFQGDARIIMIVRNQQSILESQYRDHPFEPHDIIRGKPVSFDEWYRQTKRLRYFRFTDLVFYDRLIDVYDGIFGKENVLVLPLELMKADPQEYAERLACFLNIDSQKLLSCLQAPDANVGHSSGVNRLRKIRRRIPLNIEFSRILPKFVYNFLRKVLVSSGKETFQISEVVKKDIQETYKESNRVLEKRLGLALSDLGYST